MLLDLVLDTTNNDVLEFQQQLGQDPLEWLMDAAEPSMLPESSLPIFPELSSSEPENSMDFPQALSTVSDDDTLNNTTEGVVDAALNNMVDPSVTLQSLFATH